MASTTENPPTVDTSPTAPLLEDLNRDSAVSSTSSSAMTSTIDNGKPSTSYAFSFGGSNPTAASDSGSTYTNDDGPLPPGSSKGKHGLESAADAGGSEGASASGATTAGGGSGDEEKKDDSMFECNICLDTAKDAVVSMCGHLFCWPCIHQWMNGYRNTCPVCKSSISKEKVIPLYGRGGSKEDPRKTVPPRPAGQRTEPEHPTGFQGFTGESFHMSFGIGAFPFGFFTSTLNFGDYRGANGTSANPREFEEDQFLSQMFLYVALVFLVWLVMA